MLVRLLILIALVLGTLPAPAAAAPPCHEMAQMAMDHGTAAPQRDAAPVMGKALCVGCIAPSTMKPASLAVPHAQDATHGVAAPVRPLSGALLTPEPRPPRG